MTIYGERAIAQCDALTERSDLRRYSAVGRRGLGGLLERAHLGEWLGAGDVGDRPARAAVPVRSGRFAPALRGDAALLAQQGQEDLRLLLAEPGQRPQPLEDFRAVGLRAAVEPDALGAAVVVLDDVLRERVDAAGHRTAVAVDGRRHDAHLDEGVDVGRGDLRQRETVHPVGDLARAGERVLHRVLLTEVNDVVSLRVSTHIL